VRGLGGPPEFFAEALKAPQVRQVVVRTIRTDAGQTLKLRSGDVTALRVPALDERERAEAIVELRSDLDGMFKLRRLLSRQVDLIAEHRRAVLAAAVAPEYEAA
jgi:hypothetical protein